MINRALRQEHSLSISDVSTEAAALTSFQGCGLQNGSLSISPFLVPEVGKGVLYLMGSHTGSSVEKEQRILLGPFINLLPMAFLQIQTPADVVGA